MIPVWVIRNLPAFALVAALGAAVWVVADAFRDRAQLRADLAAAEDEIAAKSAALERAAETARIHRAHLDRAADEARRWDAISNELQLMEGRDAPLSPLLAATADRLFRSRE